MMLHKPEKDREEKDVRTLLESTGPFVSGSVGLSEIAPKRGSFRKEDSFSMANLLLTGLECSLVTIFCPETVMATP